MSIRLKCCCGDGRVLFRITGSAAIGIANNGPDSTTTEWTYSAEQVTEGISSGQLSYSAVSGGIALSNKLLNRCETGNRSIGTGGTFGNGVAWDDLDTDFDGYLKPVPNGVVVEAMVITDSEDAKWGSFSFPNAVGGECE